MASNGFDKEAFIGAYTDAAGTQASAIAGAFETIERRLGRIERILALAFPDEYERVNGGG